MKKFDALLRPFITGFLPSLEGKDEIIEKVTSNFLYFLDDMDKETKKKLYLLLRLINTIALLRSFKPLKKYTYGEKEKLFNFIFKFPFKMIVAGFTGLKSLIMLAYYSLEDSWEQIGYEGPIVKRELE